MFLETNCISYTGKILYSDCYDESGNGQVPFLNRFAEVPLFGCLAGILRCVLAIIHIVIHFLATFVCCSCGHMCHVVKGCAELLRAIIEMIPLIGNIFASVMNGGCCCCIDQNPVSFFLIRTYSHQRA